MPRSIVTGRLTLRPFKSADAGAVAALVGDLDVARWLTRVPHPYDLANARDFIARMADKPLVFAVTVDSALIGCMSIDDELGYWFGKAHWGQGFATEAARAVVGVHFEASDEALRSGYMTGNDASRKVLAKLGFVAEELADVQSVPLARKVQVQKMMLTAANWRDAA